MYPSVCRRCFFGAEVRHCFRRRQNAAHCPYLYRYHYSVPPLKRQRKRERPRQQQKAFPSRGRCRTNVRRMRWGAYHCGNGKAGQDWAGITATTSRQRKDATSSVAVAPASPRGEANGSAESTSAAKEPSRNTPPRKKSQSGSIVLPLWLFHNSYQLNLAACSPQHRLGVNAAAVLPDLKMQVAGQFGLGGHPSHRAQHVPRVHLLIGLHRRGLQTLVAVHPAAV